MKRETAILKMAMAADVSTTEAEYRFEERVAIKIDSGAKQGQAMQEAYQEITGEALKNERCKRAGRGGGEG